LNYVKQAIKEGYSVILLNPNEISIKYNDFEKEIEKKCNFFEYNNNENFQIQNSSNHFLHIYDKLISKLKVKNIFIVSQSRYKSINKNSSSISTCDLLRCKIRDENFVKKMKGIVFLDATHTINNKEKRYKDSKSLIDFLSKNSINFLKHKENIEKKLPFLLSNVIECFSAGNVHNEKIPFNSQSSVFKYFKKKISL
jgi:hypothetical protein